MATTRAVPRVDRPDNTTVVTSTSLTPYALRQTRAMHLLRGAAALRHVQVLLSDRRPARARCQVDAEGRHPGQGPATLQDHDHERPDAIPTAAGRLHDSSMSNESEPAQTGVMSTKVQFYAISGQR
jgi:hypothetical protein